MGCVGLDDGRRDRGCGTVDVELAGSDQLGGRRHGVQLRKLLRGVLLGLDGAAERGAEADQVTDWSGTASATGIFWRDERRVSSALAA